MSKTRLKAEREFDKNAKSFKLPSFESPEDLERLVAALKAFDSHESYVEENTDYSASMQYEENLIPPERIFEYFTSQPFNGLVPEDERAEIHLYYPMFEITSEGMIKRVEKKKSKSKKKKKKSKKLEDHEQMLKDFENSQFYNENEPTVDFQQSSDSSDNFYSTIDNLISNINSNVECSDQSDINIDTVSNLVIPEEKVNLIKSSINPNTINVKFDSKTSSFQVFRLINLILDRIKNQINKFIQISIPFNWKDVYKLNHLIVNDFEFNQPFKINLEKLNSECFSGIRIKRMNKVKFKIGRILNSDEFAWNPGELIVSFHFSGRRVFTFFLFYFLFYYNIFFSCKQYKILSL